MVSPIDTVDKSLDIRVYYLAMLSGKLVDTDTLVWKGTPNLLPSSCP